MKGWGSGGEALLLEPALLPSDCLREGNQGPHCSAEMTLVLENGFQEMVVHLGATLGLSRRWAGVVIPIWQM